MNSTTTMPLIAARSRELARVSRNRELPFVATLCQIAPVMVLVISALCITSVNTVAVRAEFLWKFAWVNAVLDGREYLFSLLLLVVASLGVYTLNRVITAVIRRQHLSTLDRLGVAMFVGGPIAFTFATVPPSLAWVVLLPVLAAVAMITFGRCLRAQESRAVRLSYALSFLGFVCVTAGFIVDSVQDIVRVATLGIH